MYSYGSPHTAAQKQDDQHERTFSSYVRIQVVVLKTYLGRWTIGRSGERGSGISVLPARDDDDDNVKSQVKSAKFVEGKLKAPFSIDKHRDVEECPTPFYGLFHFTLIMQTAKQRGIKYHIWVFDMIRLGIEPSLQAISVHSIHHATNC